MTLFTRTDGSLWATGADDYGQLGDDGARGSKVPVTIATGVEGMTAGSYAGGFTKDQKWWGFGFDGIVNPGGGTKPLPVAENGVARVAASRRHRLILKMDGTLQAQGENDHGKLGDGSQIDRPAPVTISGNVNGIGVGENYSLFVRADGNAYGMGSIFWGVNI